MKKINDSNVEEWLDRFLDGETSCSEEQELYQYFKRKSLPPEVAKYKEMIEWYELGLNTLSKQKKHSIHHLKRHHFLYIAASLIILFTIGWTITDSIINHNKKIDLYEGCYVIKNGERVKDIDEIIANVEQMERMVAEQHALIQMAKMSSEDIINRSINEYYDDPITQQKIIAIFEN